ncbi:MAG: NUDIX hydrolase [Terriglobales bacterium]
MAREISAGGVVVRYMYDRWWMAVIEPHSSAEKRTRQSKPVIALPKGLVDGGERPEQTAVREVREETGIQAEAVTKLDDIRYVYVRSWGDRQRVFKIVSFYLLLYRSGEIGDITPDMQIEVSKAEWVPLEEAAQRLTYPGERQVAQKALAYLQAHPELAESKSHL